MSSRASLPPEDAVRAQCYINAVRASVASLSIEKELLLSSAGATAQMVDRHLDLHESSARPPKALGHVQGIAMRMAGAARPHCCHIVELALLVWDSGALLRSVRGAYTAKRKSPHPG
jgi:hypothetical protein